MKKLFGIEMFWNKSARIKAEKAAKDTAAEQKLQQQTIGENLLSAITEAAKGNDLCNVFQDGTVSIGVSKMRVITMPNNGGSYSILVEMPIDRTKVPARVNAYPIVQVDVTITQENKELHFFQCPYGPDDYYYPLSDLDNFIAFVKRYVSSFRLYPPSQS